MEPTPQSQCQSPVLTSNEAANALSVSGVMPENTIKNRLEGGHFPGAYQGADGQWKFPRSEVEAVKKRIEEARERNRIGRITLLSVDAGEPPLL
jgi:hypothetical protein